EMRLTSRWTLIERTLWLPSISWARILLEDGNPALQEFASSSSDDFVPGNSITINVGYNSEEESIFEGIIVKHGIKAIGSQRAMLVVECKDESVKMCARRKSTYYNEVKDSDIIETLVNNYGLTPDIEATEYEHKEVVQYHSTDWDFILSRAEVNGLLAVTEDNTVRMFKPESAEDLDISLEYGNNVIEFEAEMNAEHQLAGVRATTWDYINQDLISEEAEEPGFEELGNFAASDLADVLHDDANDLYHAGDLETDELRLWASARLMRSRLSKIIGRASVNGDYNFKAGGLVKLEGFGDRFNGTAFVGGVRHHIIGGRWTTNLQLGLSSELFCHRPDINAKPAGGVLPAINGLHVGIVSQIEGDEQEGFHRILVRVPYIAQEEGGESQGIWARLCNVFAGEERGMLFRPEIDDEVLLGFINDDPRDAVILGALHSNKWPAPLEATDDNFEKGIITKGAMQLLFNDDTKVITINTESGNSLKLSEEDGGIFIEDENGNKIELTSDGMLLDSPGDINLKAAGDVNIEGTNVNIAASANLVADGGAGAELTSSATATIKGSLVQIN
ncbi:MAG: type VI secretion system tip protein VgrG, partial [Bacteroidota bacterium]